MKHGGGISGKLVVKGCWLRDESETEDEGRT
jgi:hypothetical protein